MIVACPGDIGLECAKNELEGTSTTERPRLGERHVMETGAWPPLPTMSQEHLSRIPPILVKGDLMKLQEVEKA